MGGQQVGLQRRQSIESKKEDAENGGQILESEMKLEKKKWM